MPKWVSYRSFGPPFAHVCASQKSHFVLCHDGQNSAWLDYAICFPPSSPFFANVHVPSKFILREKLSRKVWKRGRKCTWSTAQQLLYKSSKEGGIDLTSIANAKYYREWARRRHIVQKSGAPSTWWIRQNLQAGLATLTAKCDELPCGVNKKRTSSILGSVQTRRMEVVTRPTINLYMDRSQKIWHTLIRALALLPMYKDFVIRCGKSFNIH